jgi:4-hydroxybenzoate polyprenyltransferase
MVARARPRWPSTALSDADIDARNPRTRMRHLPAGLLSRGFAWAFVAASPFFLAAGGLNRCA